MGNRLDWDTFLSLLWEATGDTLYMVILSGLLTVLIGLPLGVWLFATRHPALLPHRLVNGVLSLIVNIGRSLPFIILLIAVIPFTRLLMGTTLGSTAAIVPITLGAVPFFARLVENALDEVAPGRIEAMLSMGGTPWDVIRTVLLPEALPALLSAITLMLVMLIGFSSMAGVIGGGGLGDLAIRYGYQRFNQQVMIGTVVVLVILVQVVQSVGERVVRSLQHRR